MLKEPEFPVPAWPAFPRCLRPSKGLSPFLMSGAAIRRPNAKARAHAPLKVEAMLGRICFPRQDFGRTKDMGWM